MEKMIKHKRKKGEFNELSDPEEFFTQLKSRFSAEFSHFEYIIHHLFGFYSDNVKCFDNCNHYSTRRDIGHTLIIQFPDPRSSVTDTLENLMLNYKKEELLNGYKCSECERTKPNIITSTLDPNDAKISKKTYLKKITQLQLPQNHLHLPKHE